MAAVKEMEGLESFMVIAAHDVNIRGFKKPDFRSYHWDDAIEVLDRRRKARGLKPTGGVKAGWHGKWLRFSTRGARE